MSPTVLRDGPFRLFCFPREEERIHVHVAHLDGEAKCWLDPPVAIATQTGLSSARIRVAQHIVEQDIEAVGHAWTR